MRSIAPRLVVDNTREECPEHTIAEDQLEFMPVVATLLEYADGTTTRILRYTFSPEERERIARGEDLFFGTPGKQRLQPHWFCVGPPEGTDLQSPG